MPRTLLPAVVDAVLASGAMVAAEFARADGPRFSDHVTAQIDTDIEMMLRDRLLALLPARFVGEEAGIIDGAPDGMCWLVDPHDGTRAFLEGKRGSAVSVALLRHGQPVLAVVYAPTSPDRGPDLVTWAEGGRIERNGQPVDIDLRERRLTEGDNVFLNHGAWQRPVWHGTACAPAGFVPLPSIAYRLARVAVGDGLATLTLRPVNALDIAAGHALLLAAGGVLVAEDGTPVTYNDLGESRPSACFGGAPHAVEALRARIWRGSQEPRRDPRVTLAWPRRAPEAMLDRAMGCLFGLAIGGDLGPDTELGIVVARALVGRTDFDPGVVEAAIAAWRAAGGAADRASPLARAVAIGVWASDANAAREAARLDRPEDPDHADVAAMISAAVRGKPAGWETVAAAVAPDTPAHPAMARLAANRPIAAAMSGATMGRTMFPVPQVMRVLTWRPDSGLGVPHPRPEMCWTDDLPELAEALLWQGQRDP